MKPLQGALATPEDVSAWSRLWKTGVPHSCSTAFHKNYEGAIEGFWLSQFTELVAGNTIVDIGTGNGAIPLLALQTTLERDIAVDIHGVDLADISPAHREPHDDRSNISFHSGISATALPFESGSVSLLTSQYAFEYMPREACILESLRVIGHSGRLAFIIHSEDSIISATSLIQISECRYLFEESGIFPLAREMATVIAAAGNDHQHGIRAPYPEAEAIRSSFNTAATALMDRLLESDQSTILRTAAHYIHRALQTAPRSGESAAMILDHAESMLRDERTRLGHLQSAIMGLDELHALKRSFEEGGHALVLSPLDMDEGVRMGWSLVSRHE